MRGMWRTSIVAALFIVFAASAWAPEAAAGKRSDTWITMKTKIALMTADDVDAMDVNVDAIRGRVTLHGKVGSNAERAKAERIARKIDGVKSVRNLLQVIPSKTERKRVEESDEDLEEEIERAFEDTPSLTGTRIRVKSVNDGVVLLTGKARTLSEHLQALRVARSIDGVRYVASQVRSPNRIADEEIWHETHAMAVGRGSRGFDRTVSDLWITSAVKMRLISVPDVPALDVNVDTRDGVVTLFGMVNTPEARSIAEAEARRVEGVREVINGLQVVPEARERVVEARDDELERQVKKALRKETALRSANIDVQVENGVVRLSGEVDSFTDRLTAAFLARSVRGVRAVKNDLEVEGEETAVSD